MNAFIIALRELAGGIDTIARRAEPWGIMLAVLGLAITIVQFDEESEQRADERIARQEERFIRSWQMMHQPRMDPLVRARSVNFVLQHHPVVENINLADLHIEKVAWAGKKFARSTLVDVEFFGSYIGSSEFQVESGSRLRFSYSDLTDTRIYLRHDDQRDLTTVSNLSIFVSNISGARIDFGSACFDLCGPKQGDQLRDMDGSWYFAGNPPKIYIHSGNRLNLSRVRDVMIYRVPDEYLHVYRTSCRSETTGKLRCLVEKTGQVLDGDIVEILGIQEESLAEFMFFSNDWQ